MNRLITYKDIQRFDDINAIYYKEATPTTYMLLNHINIHCHSRHSTYS